METARQLDGVDFENNRRRNYPTASNCERVFARLAKRLTSPLVHGAWDEFDTSDVEVSHLGTLPHRRCNAAAQRSPSTPTALFKSRATAVVRETRDAEVAARLGHSDL